MTATELPGTQLHRPGAGGHGGSLGGLSRRDAADREARKRAIKAFLGVRESWMSFPGDLFGLSSAHVEALKIAEVPFEEATASPPGQP